MSGSTAYKQYQRTQRIIRTENNYSGGMMYVNTPLDTGYSRIILNLDLAENGTGLKPRAGLRTFVRSNPLIVGGDHSGWYSNAPYCKANSVMRRVDDVVQYTDTVILDKAVYKIGPYKEDAESFLPVTKMTPGDKPFDKDRGHCFAWQGDLYHMHTDGLYHFNEGSVCAQVTPKALSPKEAVTNGYNMLSNNPYEFSNTSTVATSGDILGILPYEAVHNLDGTYHLGGLALNGVPGEPVYLKVLLAVVDSESVLYQCRLQWRESTQGSWEDIPLADDQLKYDEESTKGVSGSTLITKGVYSKPWEIPKRTSGLPLYVRALLRVASEDEKLYKIGGPSQVTTGATLGAGTQIPALISQGLQFITRTRTEFPNTVACSFSSSLMLEEGTYLHYAFATKAGAYTYNDSIRLPTFCYRTNPNFDTSRWVEQNYHFKDAFGLTNTEPSEILNHIYLEEDDQIPIESLDDVPQGGATVFFKLAENEEFFYSNDATYSLLLKGPIVIPMTCSKGLEQGAYIEDQILSTTFDLGDSSTLTQSPITLCNLYAIGAVKAVETKYTIGAGTVLNSGDSLNNAEVYITHTLIEDVNVALGAEPVTKTAASDIAPITSVVSFVFKENSKLGAVLNYDLSTATGMCFWQNRLVLWGVTSPEGADSTYQDDSTNLLFFSELNDPSYFPYPQNVNAFTEPVLRALPFGDDLLVITATSMHLVGLNEDGSSWSSVQIQSNLRFSEDEMYLVQVVNNMVLFKSGPQFYLLVPSTTNIGNLVVAPITKNIKQIFDNPKKFIERLFMQLFSNNADKALQEGLFAALKSKTLQLNTFVDFEHIHITYTLPYVHQEKNACVTVDFLYNTSTRVWKCYTYSTTPGHTLIRKDAVKSGVYISLELSGGASIQYRMFDDTNITDLIVRTLSTDPFSNLHYLDTGLRNQDPAYNKRYREAQLKLSNHTSSPLTFYTEYSLDGTVYLPLYAPTVETSTDEDGTLVSDLSYDYREALVITGTPVLTEEVNDTLDVSGDIPVLVGYAHDAKDDVYAFSIEAGKESMLEAPFTLKLRSTILGKGYAPSLKIYSRNTTDFTILDHTWVYRIMNAR